MSDCQHHSREVNRKPFICYLLVVFMFLAGGCSKPILTPHIRVGSLDISGDLGVKGGVASGTASADSLGLDKDNAVFEPRVDLDWEHLHVTFEMFQSAYSGDGTADAALDFGDGKGIAAGVPVSSQMNINLYNLEATYDIVPIRFMDISLGLGVGAVDYDIELDSSIGPGVFSTSDTLPFGYLTGRLAKQFKRLTVSVLLRGVDVEYQDEKLSYFDFDLSGSYLLHEKGGRFQTRLAVGYRYLRVDYSYEAQGGKTFIDADFDGPYVSFSVSL